MILSGGFLGRLLGPLLKTGLPLILNVIELLAKSALIPLELTELIRFWEYDNINNIK